MVSREDYMASGETSNLPYEVGIWTQGKVGSKAVLATVKEMFDGDYEAGPNMFVWDFRRTTKRGVESHRVVQGTRRRLLVDEPEIAEFREAHPDRDMRLTTVVRDPVAINLSSFFYNFGPRNPELDIRDLSDDEIIGRLRDGEAFSEPDYHLQWWDLEPKEQAGIDVYSHGHFPTESGFEIYSGNHGERHTDLLTLRLEDLSRVGASALANFYNRPMRPIGRENTGDSQQYAARYNAFKRDAALPKQWVAWQLNSPYAQFFYDSDERERFYDKWTKKSKTA